MHRALRAAFTGVACAARAEHEGGCHVAAQRCGPLPPVARWSRRRAGPARGGALLRLCLAPPRLPPACAFRRRQECLPRRSEPPPSGRRVASYASKVVVARDGRWFSPAAAHGRWFWTPAAVLAGRRGRPYDGASSTHARDMGVDRRGPRLARRKPYFRGRLWRVALRLVGRRHVVRQRERTATHTIATRIRARGWRPPPTERSNC